MVSLAREAPGDCELLMGNEAIARGALEAGAQVATGYPGTPASEIVGSLAQVADETGMYVEWSTNEKVATEVAAAASFAGLRAFSAMKTAGLNVALDFLTHLNYSGLGKNGGGLVIAICDDPEGHSSGDEADSRWIANSEGIPLLEPDSPEEAKEMTKWAFELSEEFNGFFLVRSTTRVSLSSGPVTLGKIPPMERKAYFDTSQCISPYLAKLHHVNVLERLEKVAKVFEKSSFNRYQGPEKPELLIICSGVGSRYSLDVPVLFNQYGLAEIWDQEYSAVGVKHISAGAWDPCHFATKDPINSLADLQGKRVFTFPTAGRFLTQFGVVPVTLPWEDIETAVQTGELDGIAWSGITEDYTVGWADVTNYFLTNNISGAWAGSFFANMDRWNELPDNMKELLKVCMDQSHYYRQWWYWGGEANLRVNGDKMKLTTIPDAEWAQVEAAAVVFWDEIAAESETKAKVVEIFRKYNSDMQKAGRPYRYS